MISSAATPWSMINKDGKIVGLVFDSNIESLTADFIYTDSQPQS
ncbi:MAG: S46 family peptidase [Ignavibacteriales bacterium]|nr:S46 family peptidase [Ignavibacteriales bacterium]